MGSCELTKRGKRADKSGGGIASEKDRRTERFRCVLYVCTDRRLMHWDGIGCWELEPIDSQPRAKMACA